MANELMREVPLSALIGIPLTEATHKRLTEAGIPVADTLTEMGAQALLVLKGTGRPDCYAKEYDPTAPLCQGCVYAPRCWSADGAYLARLAVQEAEPPPGVPSDQVAARLAATKAPTVPLNIPPPPPLPTT
jgi:hypothetical protein